MVDCDASECGQDFGPHHGAPTNHRTHNQHIIPFLYSLVLSILVLWYSSILLVLSRSGGAGDGRDGTDGTDGTDGNSS